MRNKYHLKENKNRFYLPEQYTKVYNLMRGRLKFTANVLINTGARINEARNIKVEDITFGDKKLGLPASICLKVTKSKAKKKERKGMARYIPISSQLSKDISKWVKKNKLVQGDYLLLVTNPCINQGLKYNSKKAGLNEYKDFSAHSLRKTLETWLMALGVNDMKICKHIGHDIRTAMSNYVSPDIFSYQQKQDMRKIIGDLYE